MDIEPLRCCVGRGELGSVQSWHADAGRGTVGAGPRERGRPADGDGHGGDVAGAGTPNAALHPGVWAGAALVGGDLAVGVVRTGDHPRRGIPDGAIGGCLVSARALRGHAGGALPLPPARPPADRAGRCGCPPSVAARRPRARCSGGGCGGVRDRRRVRQMLPKTSCFKPPPSDSVPYRSEHSTTGQCSARSTYPKTRSPSISFRWANLGGDCGRGPVRPGGGPVTPPRG
jgi:hypothetical protein